MPQIMAVVLVGAGVVAGLKWVMRELARAVDDARLSREEPRAHERVRVEPKNLGALEWDAKSGVYRPANRRRT